MKNSTCILFFIFSISLLHAQGKLLGVTYGGGENGVGAIFRINADGTNFELIHSFDVISNQGGINPTGGFTKGSDGKLYGLTINGGEYGGGTLYHMNTDGTGIETIYNFSTSTGSSPGYRVIEGSDGNLYGVNFAGGDFGVGGIFSISKDGSNYKVLKHFTDVTNDEWLPAGSLLEASDGRLYGTIINTCQPCGGLVFSINKDGTDYQYLHFFGNSPGDIPGSNLVEGTNGELFGTSFSGFSTEDSTGILFQLNNNGTEFTVLHNFNPDTYADPFGELLIASDNKLYGTTIGGSGDHKGSIFSINQDGSDFSVLHEFDGLDGTYGREGGMIEGVQGKLFGMTRSGGVNNKGVIYSINKDGSIFTKLYDFADGPTSGALPMGYLFSDEGETLVPESHKAFQMNISPNPVFENIAFQLDEGISEHDKIKISICNNMGEVLFQAEEQIGDVNLNLNSILSNWQNGIYFVKAGFLEAHYMTSFVLLH